MAEVVGEIAPVGGVQQDQVGVVARCEPAFAVRPAEHVGGVDRARAERLGGRELQLGGGERADEWEALAEGAAGVEVGREGDGGARVHQPPPRRHPPSQEECARGKQYRGDAATGECSNALVTGCLQVVDRARAELDRERHRSLLGELVAVETECEPGVEAGGQVPARV